MHADGGCVTKAGSKRVSIGVYWGPASTFNLAQFATIGRFSNQRAELEAVVMALHPAGKRGMTKLILITYSAYALDHLTFHRNSKIESVPADGTELVLTNAKGKSSKNQDLLLEILKQLRLPTCPKTFFQLIKRAFNTEADSLAAVAVRTHLTKLISTVAVLQTRSHLRQQYPQDTSHFPE